jgi:enoyl-[acyl-carrier protein] reductase II
MISVNFPTSVINKKVNHFCSLFKCNYPLIQAGMVWVSGGKLAGACASEGIIGTIGAGSMPVELLKEHIQKAFQLTPSKFHHLIAVNFPLLYQGIEEQIAMALQLNIEIFITSAGSPKLFTEKLKSLNKKVIHVTSSTELALKCQNAGVDAVVLEGFEAGGHNGKEETTSLSLLQNATSKLNIPIIAAGGFGSSDSILAAHSLGASAVQIGSAFVMAKESSAHNLFVEEIIKAQEGSTKLLMKKYVPVRLLENEFSKSIVEQESKGASREELIKVLGKGRAKKGMLEGDLINGELEIGQIASILNDQKPSAQIIKNLIQAYK